MNQPSDRAIAQAFFKVLADPSVAWRAEPAQRFLDAVASEAARLDAAAPEGAQCDAIVCDPGYGTNRRSCERKATAGSVYCTQHRKMYESAPKPEGAQTVAYRWWSGTGWRYGERTPMGEKAYPLYTAPPSLGGEDGGTAGWGLVADGKMLSVIQDGDGEFTAETVFPRFLKGAIRSVKQAKLHGYSVVPVRIAYDTARAAEGGERG